MKKLVTIVTVCMLCSLSAVPLLAHQDRSFTNRATAGMFDDMYDLFKYSPAYQARFEKNALWTQISNLQNQTDEIIGNNPSNTYFIAAQNELAGIGHLGVAFDWYSQVAPVENTYYGESGSHFGFGEGTYVEYADLDTDEIMDFRSETYGRSEAREQYASGDLYLAYAVADIANMDFGVGVRGNWFSSNPTYSNASPYSSFISLDAEGYKQEWDLITNTLIYNYEERTSGKWSLGSNQWNLILSAAMQNMLDMGLDLVVNVAPQILSYTNDFELDMTQSEDFSPSDPAVWDKDETILIDRGCETGNWPYMDDVFKPMLLFGVDADVRLDYQWRGVTFTGWLGVDTVGGNYQNANREINYREIDRDTDYTSGTAVFETSDGYENYDFHWDGDVGMTETTAKIRAQIPFKGWRLGMGVNLEGIAMRIQEKQTVNVSMYRRFDAGNGDPGDSFTEAGEITEESEWIMDRNGFVLELPVGIIVDIVSNFNIQLGVKHTIERVRETTTNRLITTESGEYTRTYDDGTTNVYGADTWQSMFATNNLENEELVAVEQYTNMYYGMSWWPFEQVRLDLYGMSNLYETFNYRVSVNLYY